MNYTVYFDEARKRYRVRWRSGRGDTRQNVPKNLFVAAEVPHDQASKRGERIAQRWAAEEANRGVDKTRGGEYSLQELHALRNERNPDSVVAATLKRNDQMAANLTRLINLKPSAIDLDAAVEYRNARQAENARNRTIWNELVYLKQLLFYGYSNKRVTGMKEISLLTLPKVQTQESTGIALTKTEIKKLFGAPIDHGGEQISRKFLLAIATGLRETALKYFHGEWIDRERMWMDIPGEIEWRGKRLRIMKAGKALSVPVAQIAMDAVGDCQGLAFPNHKGNPSKWPWETVETICEVAKIRDFSAHDLRRTFSTLLNTAKIDEKTIGHLLGHGKRTVTGKYTIIEEELMREAVEKLDEILREILGTNVPKANPQRPPRGRYRGEKRKPRLSARRLKRRGLV